MEDLLYSKPEMPRSEKNVIGFAIHSTMEPHFATLRVAIVTLHVIGKLLSIGWSEVRTRTG